MKKAFTLIAMAMLCVVGANAQTVWKASKGNIAANSTLVDDDILTVKTVYQSTVKGDKQTIGNIDFEYYFQLRTNVDPSEETPTGTEQSGSTPLVVTAKKDAILSLYLRRQQGSGNAFNMNDNKDVLIIDQKDITKVTTGSINIERYASDGKGNDQAYGYGIRTYILEAGHTYTLYRRGSTVQAYGFSYMKNSSLTTINDYGYSTFASDKALDFTGIEGLTAYTAKVNGDVVALTPVTKVAAGTGLVLKGEGGKTYEIPGTTVEGKTESDLKAAVTETTPETEGVVNYVLSNIDDVTGFYRFTGTTIPAGKAYLQLPAAQAAKGFKMVFGDATGISNVNARKSANADNAYYTLSGIRTEAPVKGLYIRNGKKIIVK